MNSWTIAYICNHNKRSYHDFDEICQYTSKPRQCNMVLPDHCHGISSPVSSSCLPNENELASLWTIGLFMDDKNSDSELFL